MKSPRIHISIAFGDAILPVVQCEDGNQRVPLRPIAEQIGINWRSQVPKLRAGKYLARRLGAETRSDIATGMGKSNGGNAQICIRIDRVEAFLNTINPEKVRGIGNADAADWLEAKHREWDDALHAYETDGVAYKTTVHNDRNDLIRLLKARSTAGEKAALTRMIHDSFDDLGYPVQEPQQDLAL